MPDLEFVRNETQAFGEQECKKHVDFDFAASFGTDEVREKKETEKGAAAEKQKRKKRE